MHDDGSLNISLIRYVAGIVNYAVAVQHLNNGICSDETGLLSARPLTGSFSSSTMNLASRERAG